MGPEEPQKCPTIDRVQISLPTGPGVLTLDRSSTDRVGLFFPFPLFLLIPGPPCTNIGGIRNHGRQAGEGREVRAGKREELTMSPYPLQAKSELTGGAKAST